MDTSNDGAANAVQRTQPKLWVRIVALIAVMLTLWHVFASFLWIAPAAPLREVVPGNMLSSYMLPMFGQSWSVFAPEPINGDYHFNVRAVIEQGGKPVETGWVSATDVELSMIRYNLAPPRAGIQSSEVASKFKGAYDALNQKQKDAVAGGFLSDDSQAGLRKALLAGGTAASGDVAASGADAAEIETYLAQEHRSTAYATQVARAIWGENVREVQFRVSRQNTIPFAERHNADAQRPAPMIAEPGRRLPFAEAGQNDENFARTFKAQYERISE